MPLQNWDFFIVILITWRLNSCIARDIYIYMYVCEKCSGYIHFIPYCLRQWGGCMQGSQQLDCFRSSGHQPLYISNNNKKKTQGPCIPLPPLLQYLLRLSALSYGLLLQAPASWDHSHTHTYFTHLYLNTLSSSSILENPPIPNSLRPNPRSLNPKCSLCSRTELETFGLRLETWDMTRSSNQLCCTSLQY